METCSVHGLWSYLLFFFFTMNRGIVWYRNIKPDSYFLRMRMQSLIWHHMAILGVIVSQELNTAQLLQIILVANLWRQNLYRICRKCELGFRSLSTLYLVWYQLLLSHVWTSGFSAIASDEAAQRPIPQYYRYSQWPYSSSRLILVTL